MSCARKVGLWDFAAGAVVAASLFLAISASPSAKSDGDFMASAVKSTVLLYRENESGDLSMICTAVVVAKGEFLSSKNKSYQAITASHCVATDNSETQKAEPNERSKFFVVFEDPGGKQFVPVRIVVAGYQTRSDDFAILQFEVERDLPMLTVGDERREVDGSEVFSVSGQMGYGKQVLRGNISLLSVDRPISEGDINWSGAMLVNLPAAGGASGSPVISWDQRAIVGIIVGRLTSPAGVVGVALPASHYNEFAQMFAEGKYIWFRNPAAR